MKNTTNWYLYTSCASKKKSEETQNNQDSNKEIQKKIQMIKKAFR